MTTFYLPDSIRSKHSGPKYIAVVREHTPAAEPNGDGTFRGTLPMGSSLGDFASEVEALAAVAKELLWNGWLDCRDEAEAQAAAMASRRNGTICRQLRKLRQEHKGRLHLLLGLPSGEESVLLVRRWTKGRQPVPAHYLRRWQDQGLLDPGTAD